MSVGKKTVVLGSETTRLERVFGSRQVAVAVRPAVAAAPFVVSAGEGGSCSSILLDERELRWLLVVGGPAALAELERRGPGRVEEPFDSVEVRTRPAASES